MNTNQKKTQAERAASYVRKMEPAIQDSGGDTQTFIVCCKLVEFGLGFGEAYKILLEYNQRCQPPWNEAPLSRKLRCAYVKASPSHKYTDDVKPRPVDYPEVPQVSRWPKENISKRNQLVVRGGGLADLSDLSPIQLEMPSPLHVLPILFPGNPLICCGRSKAEFWTRPLSDFGGVLGAYQLIVPSPMSKLMGKIQDPEPDGPTESAHTKDNTGPRRFAVVEFDRGSSDEHAALLWHLSEYAPFVMAVHSGGKSLHGWFFVGGEEEEKVFRFYRYAVSIGADRATYTKSQFVRMPFGRRDNGALQQVYYFNPELIK